MSENKVLISIALLIHTFKKVGCIPKKLCHHAALLGEYIEYSKHYGWNVDREKTTCDWEVLKENVQNHIRAINWGYRRSNLPEHHVKYINAFGSFVDANTIEISEKGGKTSTITGRNIVIAVGGRPQVPEIPGKEHVITSDDIWQYPKHPGKTLVVGASYVALECAGFLKGIGCEVSVAVRSILLRGFDQQCAEIIGNYMKDKRGVRFIRPSTVQKVEKLENEKLKCTIILHNEGGDVTETVRTKNLLFLKINFLNLAFPSGGV